MFFRYYEYEFLLNSKFQLTDIVNALFSKDGKQLNWKNIYSKSLLETIFSQKENIVIDETDKMQNLISDILTTKDNTQKFIKFNKLRKYINSNFYAPENKLYAFLRFINISFEDFFNDYFIKNSVLSTDDDKQTFLNILINIFKYMMVFPAHTKVHNDKDSIKMLRTQAIALELQNKQGDYLKGQQDNSRLNDFTSSDSVMVYVASIDSYYHIYKKYNIIEKEFQLLIEIFEYVNELKIKNETLQKVIKELSNIVKYNIKQFYNVDIDSLF